jgi:hypothetical protein
VGQKLTNRRGLKFTVVRYGPKADKLGRGLFVRKVPQKQTSHVWFEMKEAAAN